MDGRVVLFMDYQNVYRGARECFHDHKLDHHTCGQVDPLKLGLRLVQDSPFERELKEVRIYRGRPDATKEPKGYGACTRQIDIWQQDPRVECFARTLRYPSDWPKSKAEEKGVDVALAVDFVAMAVRKEYDVGILMSTDTDLKPPLEFVCDLHRAWGDRRCEVAAWSAKGRHNRRLSVSGHKVWCHWLSEDIYDAVADPRDYNRG